MDFWMKNVLKLKKMIRLIFERGKDTGTQAARMVLNSFFI
jgi:hypothetical protein